MLNQTDHPLRNTIVLITGGGRGVGRLFACRLAAEGAHVVLAARSVDELDRTAAEIKGSGGAVTTFTADVTDLVEIRRIVDVVEDTIGPIDVLINNAGIVGPVGKTWQCEWDGWWRAIEINLGGTAAVSHAVIPKMAGRRRGRIVNMVSQAGAYRWPTVSAYSVSKAALIKFSENLAFECNEFGLKIFAYHPGVLPLGMTTAAMSVTGSSSPAEEKIAAWCRAQVESDQADLPEAAVMTLFGLLSGSYDELSGRYITGSDDLDALVRRLRDTSAYNDYRMMRPQM